MKNFYEENINFTKIKNFMKKILQAKIIKEAFSILYENKLEYPFNNQQEASNFVDNYVEFIYLKDFSEKGSSNLLVKFIYL